MDFLLTFIFGPIKSALAWLLKHPLELLILALMVACAWLYWRNDALRADLVTAHAASARQAQNVATLRAGIAAQNIGVGRLLAAANLAESRAKAAANLAESRAKAVRTIYKTRVQTIEAEQVPQQCASAAAWAQQQAQGLVAGWSK